MLHEDEPIELLAGRLVVREPPQRTPHAMATQLVAPALTMRARWLLPVLLAVSAVAAGAQETPAPQFYQLLPPNYPYALIRVCSTRLGICAIPATVMPGTPCSCQAADGTWVPGVCVR